MPIFKKANETLKQFRINKNLKRPTLKPKLWPQTYPNGGVKWLSTEEIFVLRHNPARVLGGS
jgi:hypothetical protein